MSIYKEGDEIPESGVIDDIAFVFAALLVAFVIGKLFSGCGC